ncbi:hypothetical protein L1I79_17265 [Strepomyces sp. STD 3.1]|uniref:hypothetical protein n=1 Tax=Streptomyces sp. NPDC058985 TaxID=3346684 RepID=UPI001F25394F|nr:hypothetical protein [Streptomyces sp. STD 3.1]
MPDEWNLGIELIPQAGTPEPAAEDGDSKYIPGLADASRDGDGDGSRIARARTAVVVRARQAVEALAEDVGRQIGTVAKQTATGLESVPLDETRYSASQVQLTFSVKLTGGSGKAVEAFISAGGEAQIQVTLTLDRN